MTKKTEHLFHRWS